LDTLFSIAQVGARAPLPLFALAHDALAVAVAPVTNWLYYDSIYTERYMSTPTSNPQGYVLSAVNNVTAFNGVDFLLAHGSGDDNVHYLNTASLLDKFTQRHVRGWRFRMFTDS
jgi:dipeptidyl aminopeptidase